jgi:hypothetical protein
MFWLALLFAEARSSPKLRSYLVLQAGSMNTVMDPQVELPPFLLPISYYLCLVFWLISTMAVFMSCCRTLLPFFFICFLSPLCLGQSNCNTQANLYCRGDSRFANICCPSPSVCYFKDRWGTPACCGAGQICTGVQNTPRPAVTTIAPNSAVILVSGFGQITASMNTLTASGISMTTTAAAFSTVGGLLVGAARPIVRVKEATPILIPFLLMAWHIF